MGTTAKKQTITWWTALGRVGLFVLAFACAAGVTIAPLATVLADWAADKPATANLFFSAMGAVAILFATWVMTRFVDKRRFSTVGFDWPRAFRDLSRGLGIGAAWLGASVGLLLISGLATYQVPAGFSGPLVLIAAGSALLNVLTQQLLVVGYIFQTIRAKGGFPIAVVVSALLFSALHAGAFQGSLIPPINVFAAGLVFCLAYGITENLWLPVAIHFAWNVLLGPVLGLTISGTGNLGLGWRFFEISGPDIFTGGAFGLEGGLLVTLTTTILIIILLLSYRRKKGIAQSTD